ncbi:undecaprenyl-phosphate glucose phosphotransferase [Thalassobaculum sp.]|uniref:undecaprenyl-phosphate glucose phosphotransferase n=1 Tax=Thalassobaculum sp. TaxID=2022740 RepID=UPI0032F078D6
MSNRPTDPTNGAGYRQSGAPTSVLTPSVLGTMLMCVDAIVIMGASYLAYLLWLQSDPYTDGSRCAVVTALGTIVALNCFGILRLYSVEMMTRPGTAMLRLLGAGALVAGILIALSYATKTSADYSRGWAGLWFMAAMAGMIVNRMMVLASSRLGWLDQTLSKRVVVVGEKDQIERLLKQLDVDGSNWVNVVRTFSAETSGEFDLAGLERCIRTDQIDTVVIAVPWVEEDWALKTLDAIYQFPVDVLLCPRGIGLSLIRPRVRYVADVPMLTLADRPLTGWRYVIKEVEDRVLATIILLLILPVLLAISVLIKLDSPGPVLFRQKRYGFNNQLIEVWKFRTMYHDRTDANAEQLTRRGDPRITKLGRWLRATSLDELPQFFNVLRGEMSIVGPRPHAISAKAGGLLYQEAVGRYAARHRVKPGITGWAQVNGWRGETETVEQIQRRVHHDIAYIEDWSLWLDLKIILLTIVTGFTGKNAY